MIAELDRRFTDNEVQLAACDTIFPGSPNFLNFELMAPLAKQFGPNWSIDSDVQTETSDCRHQRNVEGNKS